LKADSDTHPGRLTKSRGVTYYNHNIAAVVEAGESGARDCFKYDYVIIEGKVTEEKIKASFESPDPVTFASYPEYSIEDDDLFTKEDFDRIETTFLDKISSAL